MSRPTSQPFESSGVATDFPNPTVLSEQYDNDELQKYYPQPIIPRAYISAKGDRLLHKTSVESKRNLISFSITQRRFEFARNVNLSDRHMPDKIAEYRRQQIPEFSLDKLQIDNAFQAANSSRDVSSQTTYTRMLNKATQYHPLSAPAEICRQELDRFVSSGGLSRAAALVEEALTENETLDPLSDPLEQLAQYSGGLGHRVESLLRPVHTLQYTPPTDKHLSTSSSSSRPRALTCVAWHPTLPGIVAFVCADMVPEDARMSTCHVIVWDLAELLRPRAILLAPDTVTCLCWAPGHEGVLVCGMSTGQLCVFELQGGVVGSFAVLLGLRDGEAKLPAITSDKKTDKDPSNKGAVAPAASASTSISTLFGLFGAGEKDDIGEASAVELGLGYRHVRRPVLCPALPHPLAITSVSEAAARAADGRDALGDEISDASLPPTNAGTGAGTMVVSSDTLVKRGMSREDEANDTSLLPQLPVCVSASERSHGGPVACVRALPADIDMNKRAELIRPREYGTVRGSIVLSVAGDGKVLYWDVDELKYRAIVEEGEAAAKAKAEVEEKEREKAAAIAASGSLAAAAAEEEQGKTRWRDRYASRATSASNNNNTAATSATDSTSAEATEEEDEMGLAVAAAAAVSAAQVSQALEAMAAPWRPFQQQQLLMPGGGLLKAMSVSVGDDLVMCVGGRGGEVGVGAYAFANGRDDDATGSNGSSTNISTGTGIANLVGMYRGDKNVFQPQVAVGNGKHGILSSLAPISTHDKQVVENNGYGSTSKSDERNDRQLLLSLNGGIDSASEDEGDTHPYRDRRRARGAENTRGRAAVNKAGDDDGNYSGNACECGSGVDTDICECDATEPGTVFSSEELQSIGTPCLTRVVPVLASHARVAQSPFYNDLYLAVGQWQFAIWQRDCAFPAFVSPPSSVELTCAEWSPSRPSVIITAGKDGAVRLWDLLDSATQPQVCPVTSSPIVSLAMCSTFAPMHAKAQGPVFSVTSAVSSPIVCVRPTMQLLAVGDSNGRLHILELSQFARTSNHADIVLFRRSLRQELRRLRYRRTIGLYTPTTTTHNLTQVLHAIDTLPSNKHNHTNTLGNEMGSVTMGATADQTTAVANSEVQWTDADEQNEIQYQQMLKEWKAKLAASADTDDE